MSRSPITALTVVALLSTMLACGKAEARTENLLGCSSMPILMERYAQLHISKRAVDDALVAKAAEVYLGRVDGSKTLMTTDAATRLEGQVRAFLADVREGRCGATRAILDDQIKRQQEMEAFVKGVLATDGLAIDRTLALDLDTDKRPRPKTAAERDALRMTLIHFQLANYVRSGQSLDDAKTKLAKRYELITKRVAEQTEADVYASLLDAFADAFDPHTSYFSAEDLEDFRISMQLSLEGIGAVLRQRDGFTTVAEVVKGGAAERQGQLKPNDRIIAVAQADEAPVDVVDMSLRDVVRLIRGKKGTRVRLTVIREGATTETLIIPIVRDKIDLSEQAAKLRWESVERGGRTLKIAHIELPSFYGGDPGARGSAEDMAKLLKEARDGKADGVVLDLAMNTGGLLQHAVEIAGLFIRRGGVVRVEGTSERAQTLTDDDERMQWSGPLVVLTSRLSASASEIVAGAIKDYRRGVIVGDAHTFGKGSVQNVVNLPEGLGALKVTTALFFRPNGESTQLQGVPTDIIVPSRFDVDHFGEKVHEHAIPNQRTAAFITPEANVAGPSGFIPIDDAMMKRLAARSAKRVAESKEFDEVREELEKARKNDNTVKIADILDGKTDDPDEAALDGDGEDEDDKDKLSPQAREAIAILGDLIDAAAVAHTPRPAP